MNKEKILEVAKPILFNKEMVQKILNNEKTVTRRIINPSYKKDEGGFSVITNKSTKEQWIEKHDWDGGGFDNSRYVKSPYLPGDILYVRETFKQMEKRDSQGALQKSYIYRADENNPNNPSEFFDGQWKPSIHMPKEATRIFLKVADIKIERLQDITEVGILKEGFCDEFDGFKFTSRGVKFVNLWNSTINKNDLHKYSWEANPWVWVIEFEKLEDENE